MGFENKWHTYISTNPLGSESRLSPKLVKTMSSGVPVPSLGHLFPKLEYWRPFEALTKKCENTKHISKILSHRWRTWHYWFLDTKKIFGSGHFLILSQISWIEKKPRAKKVVNIKNQFLHARQPREGIFDICSHQCCIFTISCQSFQWLPLLQFQELVSLTWYRDIWRHDLNKFGWQPWFWS